MRRIHINKNEMPWRWKISKKGTLVLFSPGPAIKKFVYNSYQWLGYDYGDERDKPSIEPNKVRTFIEERFGNGQVDKYARS